MLASQAASFHSRRCCADARRCIHALHGREACWRQCCTPCRPVKQTMRPSAQCSAESVPSLGLTTWDV